MIELSYILQNLIDSKKEAEIRIKRDTKLLTANIGCIDVRPSEDQGYTVTVPLESLKAILNDYFKPYIDVIPLVEDLTLQIKPTLNGILCALAAKDFLLIWLNNDPARRVVRMSFRYAKAGCMGVSEDIKVHSGFGVEFRYDQDRLIRKKEIGNNYLSEQETAEIMEFIHKGSD